MLYEIVKKSICLPPLGTRLTPVGLGPVSKVKTTLFLLESVILARYQAPRTSLEAVEDNFLNVRTVLALSAIVQVEESVVSVNCKPSSSLYMEVLPSVGRK